MKKVLVYLSIAIMLPMMSWGQNISGLVLGAIPGTVGNSPVPGATVTLLSGAGDTASVLAATTTDSNGSYTFYGVNMGFMVVTVNAPGFTPNPGVAAVAVNSDTANVSVNFSLTNTAVGPNAPGSSAIGGQITAAAGNDSGIAGADILLRRRATATSAWVLVDSAISDMNGIYLFPGILPATGDSTSAAYAYSIVVTAPGDSGYTSSSIMVDSGQVALANASLSASATASLKALAAATQQGIRFSRIGDNLSMDLGVSSLARTVQIFGLNGSLQQRVSLAVGQSRALVPLALSPSNGFLYHVTTLK